MGSLQFEQLLRDFLLGAGNQIPIVKSASVQESEAFEPLLVTITEGLVEPTPETESLTVSLDTALTEVMDEIADDNAVQRSLTFSLPEEEGMKDFAGKFYPIAQRWELPVF